MKTFKFDANGHHFEFVCTSHNTRNGFAHDASVFIDGRDTPARKATCHYLNRTWENYAYQSVMLQLAAEFAYQHAEWEREDYMREHDYKRMTAKRKAEFSEHLNHYAGDSLRTWCKVYELINNHGIMEPPYPDWYGIRPKTFSPSYFA